MAERAFYGNVNGAGNGRKDQEAESDKPWDYYPSLAELRAMVA